jgi:hypothetical protein
MTAVMSCAAYGAYGAAAVSVAPIACQSSAGLIALAAAAPGAHMQCCCFAGLHNPVGEDGFFEELKTFVTGRISNSNVIILSVMTASSAVAGGGTNITLAYPLACKADPKFDRTLTILTKADEVYDTSISDALKAALEKSNAHGCVLVSHQ